MLNLIVCCTSSWGIGKSGSMPWHYHEDLKNFRKITSSKSNPEDPDNLLLMGYTTYQSIGKALPDRLNVVLTRSHLSDAVETENLLFRSDLHAAIKEFKGRNIFIIGGAQIYRQFLEWYTPDRVYLTLLEKEHECDTFFPMDLLDRSSYELTEKVSGKELTFQTLKYVNRAELEYLSLTQRILDTGNPRVDRTRVGTQALFGQRLEFNLLNNEIPVLTTKRVAFLTMAKELLWFIGGNVDSKKLEDNKVFIWKGNSSREFLDGRGLTGYREGELGPVYGFQWRHFGAEYEGPEADYTGKGVDQLQNMIDTLKTNPFSRRIIMSAWNVADLNKMALPPCHILYQLFVREDNGKKFLSAQMYQRSVDGFLGEPFNIASYALLTHMIAAITGMEAERLVMVFGDTHIYDNHKAQMREQISREAYSFPRLRFTRDLKGTNINDVTLKDFELLSYRCHPTIKAEMAV